MSNEVDIFEITQIDGFSSELTQRILSVIKEVLNAFPEDRLNIEEIARQSGATFKQVEICCHAMLITRLIKASFYPVHHVCGAAVGDAEVSVFRVQTNITLGVYNGKCSHCGKDITAKNIDIAMDFWKLGTDIKREK